MKNDMGFFWRKKDLYEGMSDFEVGLWVLKKYVNQFNFMIGKDITLDDMLGQYEKHQIQGLGLGLKNVPEISESEINSAVKKIAQKTYWDDTLKIPKNMNVFKNAIIQIHRDKSPLLDINFYKDVSGELAQKTATLTNQAGKAASSAVDIFGFLGKNRKWAIPAVLGITAIFALSRLASSSEKVGKAIKEARKSS